MKMRQKVVGLYQLGWDEVQIVLREGTGAEFFTCPGDGKCPCIKVGVGKKGQPESWPTVVSAMLHEAMELSLVRLDTRFAHSERAVSCDHDFVFVHTHGQFSEACGRAGECLAACLPDLAKVYNAWHKKPRRAVARREKADA